MFHSHGSVIGNAIVLGGFFLEISFKTGNMFVFSRVQQTRKSCIRMRTRKIVKMHHLQQVIDGARDDSILSNLCRSDVLMSHDPRHTLRKPIMTSALHPWST